MNNTNKETKRPTIRINVLKHSVWAHNSKCGVLASTKGEAITKIKELYPAEYDIIDIAAEYVKKNSEKSISKTSSEERMEIIAHMSKL